MKLLWRIVTAPFKIIRDFVVDAKNQIAAINAFLAEHGLNTWRHHLLGIFACLLGVVAFFMLPISLLAGFMGHLSIDPPNAVEPIYEAGFGFILNRWFWRCMLACSVLALLASFRWHPEGQLEAKIAREAVLNYKAARRKDWPWKP